MNIKVLCVCTTTRILAGNNGQQRCKPQTQRCGIGRSFFGLWPGSSWKIQSSVGSAMTLPRPLDCSSVLQNLVYSVHMPLPPVCLTHFDHVLQWSSEIPELQFNFSPFNILIQVKKSENPSTTCVNPDKAFTLSRSFFFLLCIFLAHTVSRFTAVVLFHLSQLSASSGHSSWLLVFQQFIILRYLAFLLIFVGFENEWSCL